LLAADNGPALAFLGLCEYQLGEDEPALVHIGKSEALGLGDNPAFVSAVRQHGALLLSRSSHFEEAMEQLQPLAAAGDKSEPVIEAYGLAALGMTRMPSVDKKELVTLAGQAAWSVVAQRPSEADVYYGQLLEKFAGEPGVHYAYGIYLLLRDPDAAAAQFQKELEVNSKNAFAYLQIAALDLKRGAPEQALRPARAAVRLDAKNALAHAALGRAFLMLGRTGDALAELESAVKLSPESPQTHFFLEQAYRRAGREADALKERAEFTRLKARQDPLSLPGR
jgi:tetratricopeptide (TPR) repeat protein